VFFCLQLDGRIEAKPTHSETVDREDLLSKCRQFGFL
jgi:hypothetical protein